jgi:predicted nucleic acid-binding protein
VIILDTNVVSEVMRRTPAPNVIAWLDGQAEGAIWITPATVLEIRTRVELRSACRRRTSLSIDIERFLDTDIRGRVVAFDSAAPRISASSTAARRRAGRPTDLCDSMIAGIALATRNARHFDYLSLALIDPRAA